MLRDILITSSFNDVFETLIEWLHEVHSCLFCVKLVIKRKWFTRSPPLLLGVSIRRSVSPHQSAPKQHLLSELNEKMERFVQYTCVPNRKTHTECTGVHTGVWWWVLGSRSAFTVTPEVLNWDQDLVLCRPVKFFHTDWINHFLFEPCLIHRDIVMLE